MGSVFAMILAAGIPTSLAAPGGYRAAYHSFVCYHDLLTPDLSISSHQKRRNKNIPQIGY